MTLQLLICTYNDGIKQLPAMLLPPLAGVSYLVSWQQAAGYVPCAPPQELDRDDVSVFPLEGLGLSRNRNNCLLHATGDVCLICDDDCRYTPEGLAAVVKAFEAYPEVDIMTFKLFNRAEPKTYPRYSFDLRDMTKVKNYFITSVEIAFRRVAVQNKLLFDERFGLGSGVFHAGEEAMFIDEALRLGLSCFFFPIEVVEQIGCTTTTTRLLDEKVLMANGAVLYMTYRPTMFLRALLVAWRLKRGHHVPFLYGLRSILKGIVKMRQLLS